MSSVDDIGELFVLVSALLPVPPDVDDLLVPVELFMLLPVFDGSSMLPLVEPVPPSTVASTTPSQMR